MKKQLWKGVDSYFCAWTYLNAFQGVSLSDAKFTGGEYSNKSRNAFLLMFALIKLLVFAPLGAVVAYWIESRTYNSKVAGSSLRSGRNCRWGEWITSTLSLHLQHHDWGALEQGTEPPTAPQAPKHWLPTGCVFTVCVCVCVFTALCVHLDGLKAEYTFQVWVTILGHTSLSLFNAPNKHVLNYFALEMAAIIAARRRHRREQKVCCRSEEDFFPHVIYLECKKNTKI